MSKLVSRLGFRNSGLLQEPANLTDTDGNRYPRLITKTLVVFKRVGFVAESAC
jgi:hypothetical protein